MANPIFQQLGGNSVNPMLQKIIQFRKTFNGNPQQIIQNMINSGKVSQDQVNQYARQANEIYKAFGGKV